MIRAFPGWDCGDWSRTAVGLVTATRNWACYRLAVVTVHPILTCSDTGSFLQSARGRSGVAPSMAIQALCTGRMPGRLGGGTSRFSTADYTEVRVT